MIFKTKDGVLFDIVPDTVICKQTEKSPNSMEKCPIKKFDDIGKICMPQLCEFYQDVEIKNKQSVIMGGGNKNA